ncbi:MAG: thiolase family protein [Burkholderiaceae bacterium]
MPALSAIVGLGRSAIARTPIGSARALAAAAARNAIGDAGLSARQIDGLLLNQSALAPPNSLPLQMVDDLDLHDLRLLSIIEGKGASVLQMLQQATLAVAYGMARNVVCVFADAPVGAGKAAGASYQNEAPLTGVPGWEARYELFGPVASYALAAQRYLHDAGAPAEALGAYPIACRRWAALNPEALLAAPLSAEQYRASRFIAEPLRLLDCAYPVNGGAAFVVTAAERAPDHPAAPVYVHGLGQGHRTVSRLSQDDSGDGPGALAGREAYRSAGIAPRDVTLCQVYDAFSICAPLALEDYGLCEAGAGLSLIAAGTTSPGGRLPMNTGGGQLAHAYLQGMTPLHEAVLQARGHGGRRQVERNDVILVTGSGGRLEYHAAAILSPHVVLN